MLALPAASKSPLVVPLVLSVSINFLLLSGYLYPSGTRTVLTTASLPHVFGGTEDQQHGLPDFQDQASEVQSSAPARTLSSQPAHSGAQNASCNTTNAHGSNCSHINSLIHGPGAHQAHSGSHSSHQHDALLFLFNALIIGAFVMHVNMKFPKVQQTVVLFILGLIWSLLLEGFKLKTKIGKFGTSYTMWMDIDPHLLLFTLLPALLAGDAMTIDTSVAKRVAWQCLYMAGPGVLVNALIVAVFLKYYFSWSFYLSLVTGSILCATDPVAVVAMLKELGASPVLTVQIQGESLLNDGTAIVLYMIAYNMLKGEQYDVADIFMFLVRTAMMAWALGMFSGYFFFTWIRFASSNLHHNSSMIQITLTLCCAYWSFIFAEGVMGWSGVLATVASSLVLAHHMWPYIVSRESMEHVWHTFDSLGNIIIFFLAGALTGETMVHIDFADYVHLFVIYIVIMLVRGCFIFTSRPFLSWLSTDKEPVSTADALVMTWGGLRGAVGLALAIQVRNDRAQKHGVYMIEEKQAMRVLFFVSGIAFLTTIINAISAPALVQWLEITAIPRAQQRLLKMVYQQLVNWSASNEIPGQVTESLRHTLVEIEKKFDSENSLKVNLDVPRNSLRPSVSSFVSRMSSSAKDKMKNMAWGNDGEDNCDIVSRLQTAENKFEATAESSYDLLDFLPDETLLQKVADITELITDKGFDVAMTKVVNKAFLSMLSTQYWKEISAGHLQPGSEQANILLTSIRVSLSPLKADLNDLRIVEKCLPKIIRADPSEWWKVFPEDSAELAAMKASVVNQERSQLDQFIRSAPFNLIVGSAILLNAVWVAVEEAIRTDHDTSLVWLVADILFTAFFFLEFVLKFVVQKIKYFKDATNIFDFILVVLGIVGVIVNIHAQNEKKASTSEARTIRIARVFRMLRFLRVFRLFHAKWSQDKQVSLEVGSHMTRIHALESFAYSHLVSQMKLVKYFAGNGKIDEDHEIEVGRCILQSQLQVYRALDLIVHEKRQIAPPLRAAIAAVMKRKKITEKLEHFVMDAMHDGAISARDAETIMHPLHHQISEIMQELNDLDEGIIGTGSLTPHLRLPPMSDEKNMSLESC